MVDKNRLLAITELKITAIDDKEFDEYIRELFFFCDTLPSHKESIKTVLTGKQYDAFLELCEILKIFLINIHAMDFAGTCVQIASELKQTIQDNLPVNHEKLEEDTDTLFAALDTLFVDILVAGYIVKDDAVQESSDCLPSEALEKGEDAATKPRVRAANILVADDAKFFLNTLQLYFQKTPHRLTCVNSAKDALFFLRQKDSMAPDLFILDADMPDMNGYELAQNIRAAGMEAPIIFMLVNPTKKTVLKALESGAADVVVKSITKKRLLERVVRHL